MGFININGNQVHTSALSSALSSATSGTIGITNSSSNTTTTITPGSNLYYSNSSGTFTTQLAKTTYNVLGEDIEVDGFKDGMTSLMVAQLNVLGKEFYYELKKQDCHFPQQIDDFLQKKFEIEETAKEFIKYQT